MAPRTFRSPSGLDIPYETDFFNEEELASWGAAVQPLPTDLAEQPGEISAGVRPEPLPGGRDAAEAAFNARAEAIRGFSPMGEEFSQDARRSVEGGVPFVEGKPVEPRSRYSFEGQGGNAGMRGTARVAAAGSAGAQQGARGVAEGARGGRGVRGVGVWVNPLVRMGQELESEREDQFGTAQDLAVERAIADENLVRAQVDAENERAKQIAADVERQRLAAQEIERENERLQSRIEETARAAAEKQIDFGKYWSDRSNFARAMGALAMVLGAQASDGRNRGMEYLDKAIDREVQEQEFAAEQAWRENKEARNQFADFLEAHGSPAAARAELRAVLYAQADHEARRGLMRAGLDRQQVETNAIPREMRLAYETQLTNAKEARLLALQRAAMGGGGRAKPSDTKTQRAALEQELVEKRRRLREFQDVKRDYLRWTPSGEMGIPDSPEERAQAMSDTGRVRNAYHRVLLGRVDAPGIEEQRTYADMMPEAGRFNVLEQVGVGGYRRQREGAAAAIEEADANLRREIEQAEQELRRLQEEEESKR